MLTFFGGGWLGSVLSCRNPKNCSNRKNRDSVQHDTTWLLWVSFFGLYHSVLSGCERDAVLGQSVSSRLLIPRNSGLFCLPDYLTRFYSTSRMEKFRCGEEIGNCPSNAYNDYHEKKSSQRCLVATKRGRSWKTKKKREKGIEKARMKEKKKKLHSPRAALIYPTSRAIDV